MKAERKMLIYVDIDNTICTPDPNWNTALKFVDNI